MNKVILIGRLTKDPEVRYTQAAEPVAVCRFSVAVNRPFAKEGEITADFINCIAFGKRGENINQYFGKGSRIALEGRIQTGSYTDQQGNKKYTTDIIVDNFEFVDTKAERQAEVVALPPQADNSPEGFSIGNGADDDEDLPF